MHKMKNFVWWFVFRTRECRSSNENLNPIHFICIVVRNEIKSMDFNDLSLVNIVHVNGRGLSNVLEILANL